MLSSLREGPEAWLRDPELLQPPYVTTDKSLPPGLSSFSLEMDYMTCKLAFVLYFLLVFVNAHTHTHATAHVQISEYFFMESVLSYLHVHSGV